MVKLHVGSVTEDRANWIRVIDRLSSKSYGLVKHVMIQLKKLCLN